MVGLSQDAHNDFSVPALREETPKALRVAVVENDPRIQQLIIAEITDEGHACICFGSAEDFLDEAGSDRFDLLLLDLMLPGMDGLACLKQLQLKAPSEPALRVVIVTALNDPTKNTKLWLTERRPVPPADALPHRRRSPAGTEHQCDRPLQNGFVPWEPPSHRPGAACAPGT